MQLSRALVVLLLAAPALAQDTYTLRIKPQAQALKYRAFEANVAVVMRAGEDPAASRTERGALELYRIKPAGDALELAVDTVNVTFARDGVAGPAPAQPPPRAKVNARGFAADGTVPSPLALILPEGPVKVGPPVFGVRGVDTAPYTVTVEPSPSLPVRVPVLTRVAGTVSVNGRTCLRLETSARVSEKLAGGTRLYEYVLSGWFHFDPELGTVVESSIEERVDDAVLPVPKSGTVRKRRETVRTARLEP